MFKIICSLHVLAGLLLGNMSPIFHRAAQRAQWFGGRYAGSRIDPNVLVLHTTEGTSWPSYEGGAQAPHLTAMPDFKNKRLVWHQHYPLTVSSRALRNESGGVETNTLNAVQIELVGTCSRASWLKWRASRKVIFWPKAPKWALRDLAEFVKFMDQQFPAFKVRDAAPRGWLPYPKSYGASKARMSNHEWSNAYGIVGHQHVPENTHGDPGCLDVDQVIAYATGSHPAHRKPSPGKPNPNVKVTRGKPIDAIEDKLQASWHRLRKNHKRIRQHAVGGVLRFLRKTIKGRRVKG